MSEDRLTQQHTENKGLSFKVWGVWYNKLMMTLEMVHHIGAMLLVGWLAAFSILCLVLVGYQDLKLVYVYYHALILIKMGYGGEVVTGGYTASRAVHILHDSMWWLMAKVGFCGVLASGIFLFVVPIRKNLERKSQDARKDVWLEGAKMNSEEETNRLLAESGKAADIPLGKVHLPVEMEGQHIGCYGQTGTGKTKLLNWILKTIFRRGDRMVIHDEKGDMISTFYCPENSLIFNPLDTRHMEPFGGWTLFNEIRTVMDVVTVANSIIPEGTDRDKFFNMGARHVLIGLLRHCFDTGQTTNRDVWRVVSLPTEDIAEILKVTRGGEKGYSYLSNPTTPLAGSIKAVMMQYMTCFEYMCDSDGSFCIGDWVADERPQYKYIYVSNKEEIAETLRPVLSLFFDVVASRLLALKEDRNRRLFLILDELGSLNQLSSLIKFLTKARSKGGVCIFLIQTIAQLEENYGKPGRSTIVNNHATTVTLRVTDPDTADFLSKKIGKIKRLKTQESMVLKTSDQGEGITLSTSEVTEELVLPSTIMNLPNLHCYVTMPGFYCTKTTIVPEDFPALNEPFVIRPGFSLEEIKSVGLAAIEDAAALKERVSAEIEKQKDQHAAQVEQDAGYDAGATAKGMHYIDDDVFDPMA